MSVLGIMEAVADRDDGISATEVKPVIEVVNSDSNSDEDPTSGDEELLEERWDTLTALLRAAKEESQLARDNVDRLQKAAADACEEVSAACAVYTEVVRKRNAEISSTSKEIRSIFDKYNVQGKLERRSKKAKIQESQE